MKQHLLTKITKKESESKKRLRSQKKVEQKYQPQNLLTANICKKYDTNEKTF